MILVTEASWVSLNWELNFQAPKVLRTQCLLRTFFYAVTVVHAGIAQSV